MRSLSFRVNLHQKFPLSENQTDLQVVILMLFADQPHRLIIPQRATRRVHQSARKEAKNVEIDFHEKNIEQNSHDSPVERKVSAVNLTNPMKLNHLELAENESE